MISKGGRDGLTYFPNRKAKGSIFKGSNHGAPSKPAQIATRGTATRVITILLGDGAKVLASIHNPACATL